MTPAIMFRPDISAPGELGRSMDTIEDSLVCLDERELAALDCSRSPPRDLPSSLAFLLSFLLLLEKNDFPPEDCRVLPSAPDILEREPRSRCDYRQRRGFEFCGRIPSSPVQCALAVGTTQLSSSPLSQKHSLCILPSSAAVGASSSLRSTGDSVKKRADDCQIFSRVVSVVMAALKSRSG